MSKIFRWITDNTEWVISIILLLMSALFLFSYLFLNPENETTLTLYNVGKIQLMLVAGGLLLASMMASLWGKINRIEKSIKKSEEDKAA